MTSPATCCGHSSDCAVHGAPAISIGLCNCDFAPPEKIRRHIVAMINSELQTRLYTRDREARGLSVGDITEEEFHDYQNDVDFEKEVLRYFNSMGDPQNG